MYLEENQSSQGLDIITFTEKDESLEKEQNSNIQKAAIAAFFVHFILSD